MNQLPIPKSPINYEALQKVVLSGDLSSLNAKEKLEYYKRVCELVGINPITKPFDYIKLSGKEVLYANKGCGEQLRMLHQISIKIVSREKIDEVYVVTAEASRPDGRVDSSTGAVSLDKLKGETLANAMMKAETKAKRRVTLSICGLNMLDELEVETIHTGTVRPEQPGEEDGYPEPEPGYRIPFGKFAKRSLEEVDVKQLGDYVLWLEAKVEKEGKPLRGEVKEFVERASDYLAALENEPVS